MSDAKKIARYVFWSLFLPSALIFGWYAWQRGIPQQVDRYTRLMGHPNAEVASKAWWDLRQLYFTKWKAYDLILDMPKDDRPISFLIEKDPAGGQTAFRSEGKPIYYKTDRIYCRTVSEAVMAFVYSEHKWKTDFQGDWDAWWLANKGLYGRP